MSLATRCTGCSTVFRVVQDQLKVSEGWVRCGRCSKVFNALEGLFDLDRDALSQWPPGPSQVSTSSAEEVGTNPLVIDTTASPGDPSLIDKIDAQLLGSHRGEGGSTPSARINERDRLEFPDAQFDPDLLGDNAAPPDPGADSGLISQTASEPDVQAATPQFMRHAQRQARWRGARMRTTLLAVMVALLAALALQAAHHFRDLIAARWSFTRPALAAWCDAMSCSIEAPRRIDDVSVESSALIRASSPDAFKLSVALRNRGVLTVALPSVDLSLTDPTGQLVARRVLAPRDFRAATVLLLPGAESHLQLLLTAGTARITGYTVEIFYP